MTGLLVSVRDAEEARLALAGGSDIIDVKEPARGPLGPADPDVWQAVLKAVAGRAAVSIVLGELASDPALQLAPSSAGFAFAKVGLAGCGSDGRWPTRLSRLSGRLPASTFLVPVAYADWERSGAPHPLSVLELAAATAGFLVIDTFDKAGGSLLEIVSWDVLEEWMRRARTLGTRVTLAGSLREPAIARLMALEPDYFGVRGAVCHGGRAGHMDASLVRDLANLVHAPDAAFVLAEKSLESEHSGH